MSKKDNVSYEQKIERILGNSLEFNGDNEKAISDCKVWLKCEWLCSNMEMCDYSKLLLEVDDIAQSIISSF